MLKASFNMMCKALCLVCALLICTSAFPVCALGAQDLPKAQVLLVHNPGAGKDETESIRFIVDTLTYLGRSVALATPDEAAGSIDQYGYVIAYSLKNTDGAFIGDFLKSKSQRMIIGSAFMLALLEAQGEDTKTVSGAALLRYPLEDTVMLEGAGKIELMPLLSSPEYSRGSIIANAQAYPLFSRRDGIFFIPVTQLDSSLMTTAFAKELVFWMWPYLDSPPAYAQYFVLDGIYPFTDLERLKTVTDLFKEAGVPFVISVMPIYQNADYPAFERFCSMLRYAQASGGAVILHAPIIQTGSPDQDALFTLLTDSMRSYARFGVYALGIQAPESWMYDELYRGILSRYSTVFIYRDSGEGFSLSDRSNIIHESGHQLIAPALQSVALGHFAYSTAVYLDANASAAQTDRLIKDALLSFAPMKSLWSMEHSVYGNDYHLSYDGSRIMLDGVLRELDAVYEPRSDFSYNRNMLNRITVDLTKSNRMAILFVFLSFLVFAACILAARKRNRKNFFHD